MANQWERDYLSSNLLPLIELNATRISEKEVTGFLAMTGSLYSKQLMVVGRSVNGWTDPVAPASLAGPDATGAYAGIVFESVTRKSECPMKWVSDSWGNWEFDCNTKSSAFWRVIRLTIGKLGIAAIEGETWPSHIVWSNLYKISPAKGRNPSNALCDIQLPSCIALLQEEVATYLPNRLLFLTDLDWAFPFLQTLAPNISRTTTGKYVQAIGTMQHGSGETATLVVAAHPQGKREEQWVEEVVSGFKLK